MINDETQEESYGAILSGGGVLHWWALFIKTVEDLCHLLPLLSQSLVEDNKNKPAITETVVWGSRASKL